jgi:hypothetical protein
MTVMSSFRTEQKFIDKLEHAVPGRNGDIPFLEAKTVVIGRLEFHYIPPPVRCEKP